MSFPYLGHGIGLRPPHYAEVLETRPDVGWFEVITENFLAPGGNPRRVLRAVRERWPIVLHGVSMNLGSVDPLDETYLARVRALADEIRPAWISDHLCWGGVHGRRAHDLWPLPLCRETLDHVAARVDHAQERLGREIAIENVSTYVGFAESDRTEWELLSELTRRTGCRLLLDVNNVFVSARNLGFDPYEYVAGIPIDRVVQVHLAGHEDRGTHLLDTHDQPVCEDVWSLYRALLARGGPVSTLVEWDDRLPPLAALVEESRRAAAIAERGGPRPASPDGGARSETAARSRPLIDRESRRETRRAAG